MRFWSFNERSSENLRGVSYNEAPNSYLRFIMAYSVGNQHQSLYAEEEVMLNMAIEISIRMVIARRQNGN